MVISGHFFSCVVMGTTGSGCVFTPYQGDSKIPQFDSLDDGASGVQHTSRSAADPDSAVNECIGNADEVGYKDDENDDDNWTKVHRDRKNRPLENDSRRSVPAGLFATPYPSDIKLRMRLGDMAFDVYATPKTATEDIKCRAFKESASGAHLPDTKNHLGPIKSSFN